MPPRLADTCAFLITLFWAAGAAYVAAANPTIHVLDVFGFIRRAEALSLDNAAVWIDGLYPFGYPLLLRGLYALTGDYVVAGKALSLIAGIVGLAAIYGIARSMFPAAAAVLAVAICAMNPLYLSMAIEPSTDMPAAALLLLGIAFACVFARRPNPALLVLSGAVIGIGYLTRYTALVAAAVILVWLLVPAYEPADRRRALRSAAIFAGAFILFASPQLIVSLFSRGNPFYNEQARNVHFGMFGDMNWGLHWNESRSRTSLVSIVAQHPKEFVRNWYGNFYHSFRLDLVPYPLMFFAFAGLLLSLWIAGVARGVVLVLLALFAFIASIAIAFVTPRLLLPSAALLAILAGYGIWAGLPEQLPLAGRRHIPLRKPVAALLLAWLAWTYLRPSLLHPLDDFDRDRITISQALLQQGARHASETLSFSFAYYDLSKPTKDRYPNPWYAPDFKPFESLRDIAARMRQEGRRFLLFDQSAPDNVPGLKAIWPLPERELALYLDRIPLPTDRVSLYRLK